MLEIKNLNKTYYPKNGEPVKALDDLSLKIGDRGLVFILGKSGSGKSTLLNLLGGLDSYDSGDIIIKGKSTKDFKQKDFDSYRNTLIGFVFQEYNLLDEFSVGANIALAIELQGRKATNEEVNSILAQVDLDGYGSRKTNELSGGQKQRIAIARALVKNPEIIFADEPTGALDSNTGLQIFEFLRNLSKDKLVIVVSHDREFAESFGDRVIELSDGRVISDIIKVNDNNINIDQSKNLNYSEQDGFIVKENYSLTNEDLKQINDYLLKYKTLKISAKENLTETKKVFVKTDNSKLKISEENESFELVKSKLPLSMAFKMGASALNHKKVRLVITILLSMVAFVLFGIADTLASYNKVNAFTNSIIDNDITNLVYNKEKLIIRGSGNDTYEYFEGVNSNLLDLEILKNRTNINFKPVYGPRYYENELPFNIEENLSSDYFMYAYYSKSLSGLMEINNQEMIDLGFTLYGNLPKNNDEIVITSYIFEHFKHFGYRDRSSGNVIPAYSINDYSDVLDLEIVLNNRMSATSLRFKIVGVVDTMFDSSEYQPLKDSSDYNYLLYTNLQTVLSYSYHSIGFLNEGMIDILLDVNENEVKISNANFQMEFDQIYKNANTVYKLTDETDYIFFDTNKTKLATNEAIISIADILAENYYRSAYFVNNINYSISINTALQDFNQLLFSNIKDYVTNDYLNIVEKGIYGIFDESDDMEDNLNRISNYFMEYRPSKNSKYFTKSYNEIESIVFNNIDIDIINNPFDSDLNYNEVYSNVKDEVLLKYAYLNYKEAFNNGFLAKHPINNDISDYQIFTMYYQYLTSNNEINTNTFTEVTIDQILVDAFKDLVNDNPVLLDSFNSKTLYKNYSNTNDIPQDFDSNLKIVGISFNNLNSHYELNHVVLNDDLFEKIKKTQEIDPFGFFIAKMPKNKNTITDLINFNYTNFDNYFYRIQNEVTPTLNMANSLVEDTASIFLYIGIGFAFFAGLMLSNFIASSVNFKKREIGILRALGARSHDVFEIFLQESLIIAVINYLTSLIGTIIAIFFINRSLRIGVGLKLTIFNFGFRQVILLLLISLFVAIIASFFPVYRIAKKKPIDAITNK